MEKNKNFKPTYIAIHHTAVSRKDQKAQFYPVNRYHKEKFNMKSELGYYIGYNFYIGTNGVVTQTRRIGEETAAIKGHNFDTVHLCLAGDFNIEIPLKEQITSLKKTIDELIVLYPNSEIKLHRDLAENRTCPGKLFSIELLYPNDTKTEDGQEEKENRDEILRLSKELGWYKNFSDQLMIFIINFLKKK